MTLFPKQLTYVKEFDSIRAIAVLLVILAHWFPGGITSSFSFECIGLDIFPIKMDVVSYLIMFFSFALFQ
jgi:peptidoglycan/LPS O-acetylase OafA/YrhL